MIAVTSASPGAGKSPTVRYLAELLSGWNLRVAVIRHPLRDQDFAEDRAHAFTAADGATTRDACAEPQREPDDAVPNVTVFSGLDFGAILRAAEAEADVVVWDGAGSDLPFLRPSLHILLTDPLRADEEADQFPGEVGLRMADVVVVSKCDSASGDQVATIERAVAQVNPDAVLLTADSPVLVENGAAVTGLTVVVVEEELTLSLGALKPGAGSEAAHMVGASGIISPLPQASGRLAELYARHPEAQSVLPVTGYDARDLAEVKATLEATPSEAVIDATRVDLAALLGLARPVAKAGYTIRPHDPERLAELVRAAIGL